MLPKSVDGCLYQCRQGPDENGGLGRLIVHQLRKLTVKLFFNQPDRDQRLPRYGRQKLFVG